MIRVHRRRVRVTVPRAQRNFALEIETGRLDDCVLSGGDALRRPYPGLWRLGHPLKLAGDECYIA